MALFSPAFEALMDDEDRGRTWKEVIDNNGGGVIGGINSKSFPDDYAKIKAFPQAQRGPAIASFYQLKFWMPYRLGEIDSQDVANRVLNMGVNAGMGTSIKLLQQAVNALTGHGILVEDGKVGMYTLTAVNTCDQEGLLDAYRMMRLDHYKACVERNPADAKYLGTEDAPGPWWRRAMA